MTEVLVLHYYCSMLGTVWGTYVPPDDSDILGDCETSLATSHNNLLV